MAKKPTKKPAPNRKPSPPASTVPLYENEWDYKARASCAGKPYYRSGMVIAVSNVGKWGGKWLIHSVRHSVGSQGYDCVLELVRNGGKTPFTARKTQAPSTTSTRTSTSTKKTTSVKKGK